MIWLSWLILSYEFLCLVNVLTSHISLSNVMDVFLCQTLAFYSYLYLMHFLWQINILMGPFYFLGNYLYHTFSVLFTSSEPVTALYWHMSSSHTIPVLWDLLPYLLHRVFHYFECVLLCLYCFLFICLFFWRMYPTFQLENFSNSGLKAEVWYHELKT